MSCNVIKACRYIPSHWMDRLASSFHGSLCFWYVSQVVQEVGQLWKHWDDTRYPLSVPVSSRFETSTYQNLLITTSFHIDKSITTAYCQLTIHSSIGLKWRKRSELSFLYTVLKFEAPYFVYPPSTFALCLRASPVEDMVNRLQQISEKMKLIFRI